MQNKIWKFYNILDGRRFIKERLKVSTKYKRNQALLATYLEHQPVSENILKLLDTYINTTIYGTTEDPERCVITYTVSRQV